MGALTKLYAIQNSPVVNEKMPAVADAAHFVGLCPDPPEGHDGGKHLQRIPFRRYSAYPGIDERIGEGMGSKGGEDDPIDEFFTGV